MKYGWIFGGLIIIIDQISKFIILKNYPQWVSLNQGIAFGLFASSIWTILSLLCLLILSILPKKDFNITIQNCSVIIYNLINEKFFIN